MHARWNFSKQHIDSTCTRILKRRGESSNLATRETRWEMFAVAKKALTTRTRMYFLITLKEWFQKYLTWEVTHGDGSSNTRISVWCLSLSFQNSGMNQGVTGSNPLATSQFATKSCLFLYYKRWRSLIVITYRKALVFNHISSMCGKRWNRKETEESVRQKLVVQQHEGFRLPSVFLARPSLWCAETHNLDKFMQNNFELRPTNPMTFSTHLVPEVIWVVWSFSIITIKRKKAPN